MWVFWIFTAYSYEVHSATYSNTTSCTLKIVILYMTLTLATLPAVKVKTSNDLSWTHPLWRCTEDSKQWGTNTERVSSVELPDMPGYENIINQSVMTMTLKLPFLMLRTYIYHMRVMTHLYDWLKHEIPKKMLLKDTRLWTGGKKAKKMPEIRKMPNQNLPAKWNKKTPDFWNLALKTPIWQPCV